MRWILFLFLLFSAFLTTFGQQDSTTVSSRIDSMKFKLNTLQERLSSKADSLPNLKSLQSNKLTDTVAFLNARLDSIQHSLSTGVDSIQNIYTTTVSGIQRESQKYKTKIDSLQRINLPTDKYTAKLDSLGKRITSLQQDLGQKIEGIKKKATDKIKDIPVPPELKEKAGQLTSSIGNLSPQTLQANLPEGLKLDQLGLPNTDLAGSANIPDLNLTGTQGLPGVPSLNKTALPDLPGVKDINGMENVSALGGKAGEVQSKVNEVTNLKPESIDKLAESNASRLKEVQGIQEQTANLPPTSMKTEEEMKAELKNQAKAVAVDHFAGKQEQLKAAMERISKYKAKYPEVNSMADVAKKPANAMKGKPLIERIIPGIGLQIQKRGDNLLVDFNPYAGYRFTGRITAGAGWNQRVPYNPDIRRFTSTARIYGPRVYGEFKLGKGFFPRAEVELMHTLVPPLTQSPTVDPGSPQWVWGVFTGMKKEYKFFGSVKGTASVMVRLFDPHHKSPYADVINARVGFEFPKKKDKKSINKVRTKK